MAGHEDHFRSEATGTAEKKGRFVSLGEISPVEMLPGLEFQPVLGERTMVNFVSFGPHAEAPHHAHEEEQIVVILEGEFEFNLDGEVRTMRAGDVAACPAMGAARRSYQEQHLPRNGRFHAAPEDPPRSGPDRGLIGYRSPAGGLEPAARRPDIPPSTGSAIPVMKPARG